MANPMIRIHDIESGEIIDREMTAEELAQYKKDQKANDERIAEIAARETAKSALLERLGITADEAAILLS